MKNFDYAKSRDNKSKPFDFLWFRTENYECFFLLLPILPFCIIYDKIKNAHYKRTQWSEEKAKIVLDYFLPHVIEYNKDKDEYWYFSNMTCLSRMKKYAPIGLKTFADKFDYQIIHYLPLEYEKDGFVKTVKQHDYAAVHVTFKEK